MTFALLACAGGLAAALAAVAVRALQRPFSTRPVTRPSEGAVLITGGRSGIGRFCAEMLAKKGWTVLVTVRKAADAEAISREGLLLPIVLDVSDGKQFKPAAEQVEALLKKRSIRLAAVVANAGINPEWDAVQEAIKSGKPASAELAPLSMAESVLSTNFMGVVRTVEAFLPRLRADRGRVIIVGSYFGSLAGAIGLPHLFYESSKSALEGFADGLRRSLGPDAVAVSLVKPGNILTNMNSQAGEDGPQIVGDAVVDALVSPRPRARYYVGRVKGVPVWLLCRVFSLLPEALTDLLV